MSRRNISKKKFPSQDPIYESYLVNLLIARILKKGKKTLAQHIIKEVFNIVTNRTGADPILIFEKAIKNVSPIVEVKACRVGGSTYQVPIEVKDFRGITLALRWIIKSARSRAGKTIAIKLASEIIDASNLMGKAVKKKEETHKMAEANKAFAHYRY
jgi:small subunit ribosomal protein S7|uniref:ribosomal protein S7 n=1 Tax=Fibrocapsa japonica TaxID=94617 RepID=UPI002114A4C3|nr:ribosomal protein S7 [Fibrocapsa japonica]UTE95133.1 ribosomal protein S7 [Fibrocapsa japonica]